MLCKVNGKPYIQAWDLKRNRYAYIPIRKWFFMSARARNRYETEPSWILA